ncbi:MAG: hypothetical protein HY906_21020 [Deltaproteobacteria bacterium]|nr:hypothetical protein [Deltaproteobacteria bacterium]
MMVEVPRPSAADSREVDRFVVVRGVSWPSQTRAVRAFLEHLRGGAR